MRGICKTLISASLLVPLCALADANITVDGITTDWPSPLSTCFVEAAGDSSNNKVDLDLVCLENNNTSGNNGSLFAQFETVNASSQTVDNLFAISIDTNNDGVIGGSDEIWAAFFPKQAGDVATELRVYLASNLTTPVRTYAAGASCGGSAGADGWSAVRNSELPCRNVTRVSCADQRGVLSTAAV